MLRRFAPARAGVDGQLARKLLGFFLVAAWLPLVILLWTSLRHFEQRLVLETKDRLAYRAKASGLEIFGRLQALSADLEVVGSGVEPDAGIVDLLPRWLAWRDRFTTLIATGAPDAALERESRRSYPRIPELGVSAIRRVTEDQRPLLVEGGHGPQGAHSLWLVTPLPAPSTTLVWAELRTDWLWPESQEEPPDGVAWALLGTEREPPFASSPNPPTGLIRHFAAHTGPSVGRFEWRDSERSYFASFWTVPLGYEFAHSGLVILVNEPDLLGEPVAALRRYLSLLAAGALLLVALFGIRRLRSDLGPLERLTEGAHRLAAGDLTARVEVAGRDEVARLSRAFNVMAQEIEAQADHRIRLLEELDRANWGALTALARAVDAKSAWTHGHSSRVAAIAVAIANEVGFSDSEVRRIRRSALVHDVGKIGVPGVLLDKTGPLTPEETLLVRSHVEQGVRILEPIAGLADVLPIVWQHHERLDGTGYPKGLRDKEIDPGAALVAVADVFEALTTERPYRPPWDLAQVEAHLQRQAGIRYEFRFVEALLRIHRHHGSWLEAVPEKDSFRAELRGLAQSDH